MTLFSLHEIAMGCPLILAGASVRSLAESAIADGFTPWCVDMFADADLCQILQQRDYPDPVSIRQFTDLPSALQGFPPDVPLVWSGGLENHPDLLNRLSQTARVCGHPPDRLAGVRDCKTLHSVVAGTGCRVPEWADDDSAIQQGDGGRWLVKSTHSSGGIGVRSFDGRRLNSHEYLQQYVSGMAVSALFCRDQQSVRLLGTCGQIIGEKELGGHGFAFCGNVGPIRLSAKVQALILEVGRELGKNGCVGVYGADFVVGPDDVWLIEVNPRVTASHEIYDHCETGATVLRQHLEAFNDGPSSAVSQPTSRGAPGMLQRSAGNSERRILARLIVYANRNSVISEPQVKTLLGLCRLGDQQQTWLADVPLAGQVAAGQPFCSVYHMLRQDESGWIVSDGAQASHVDRLLAGMAGVPNLSTSNAAVRYACLFESAVGSDNAGTLDLLSSPPG